MVSQAVVIAKGVTADAPREALGCLVGNSGVLDRVRASGAHGPGRTQLVISEPTAGPSQRSPLAVGAVALGTSDRSPRHRLTSSQGLTQDPKRIQLPLLRPSHGSVRWN